MERENRDQRGLAKISVPTPPKGLAAEGIGLTRWRGRSKAFPVEKSLIVFANVLALVLAGLILANSFLNKRNDQLVAELNALGRRVQETQRADATLRELTGAIARDAMRDSALRALMVRMQLKARVTVDGVTTEVP